MVSDDLESSSLIGPQGLLDHSQMHEEEIITNSGMTTDAQTTYCY